MAGLWKKFNPANDLYDQPLAYRGTIAPFGTYTNPDGSESAGFAWPGMITEPLNALQRLHENSYTEDGRLGMPNPQYQGNKDDALTSLLSIYGGNALNPMAKVPANALASSAFKVEGKPALSKFLRHDEDKSLGDTEVTRYLLNLADEKVARIPADVTRGSESFGLRGFKRSLPPDTVTQKGYDFHGMHHPELDDYVQYKNLWHSQDGLLNHIDKLSERVAKFGLRGHLTPQEVANSKAYYQKLRDHVSSDDWDGSVFSDTGRPSIAGSAIAAENANAVKAWHSTPAKFDTFDNAYTDEVGFHFGSKNQAHNRAYVESGGNPWTYFTKWRDIPVEMDVKNPANISRDVGQFNGENVARQLVKDSIAPIDLLANVMNQPEAARNAAVRNWLVENGYDAVKYPNRFEGVGDPSYMMLNTGNVKHARTGETLYSDTGKPSIAGATAASADQDEISLDEFLRRYGVTY